MAWYGSKGVGATDLLRHWAEGAGWTWCGEMSQGQGLLALGLAGKLSRPGEADGSPPWPSGSSSGRRCCGWWIPPGWGLPLVGVPAGLPDAGGY